MKPVDVKSNTYINSDKKLIIKLKIKKGEKVKNTVPWPHVKSL